MIQSGPREATARSRKISQLDSSHRDGRLPDEGYLKLDSHADTACVGADCNAIHYIEHSCEVSPFHPGYEPLLDVPIVQTTTAYTDPENGKTYILIINEALPFGDALCTWSQLPQPQPNESPWIGCQQHPTSPCFHSIHCNTFNIHTLVKSLDTIDP